MRSQHTVEDLTREFRSQPIVVHDLRDGADATPGSAATPATKTDTVATYLNKRLREIGVKHVFAIPGDYIAEWVATLDEPDQNEGLVRVHPNNEMLATYAADGYGRIGRPAADGGPAPVGCVAFTYGVGVINAAQAVAGAYVERVPMVVIGGSPSTAQFNSDRDQGVTYHHMIDGSHTDMRIFNEITAMAVHIDNPATAPDLIDAALSTCLASSRPVYVEIANTVSGMPCRSVPEAALTRQPIPTTQKSLDEAVQAVHTHIQTAKRLVVVAGSEVARVGKQDRLASLLGTLDAPYATSPLGKSVLSELRDDLRYQGVYFGRSSPASMQELMSDADCVVTLGVQDTDFNYLGVVTPDYDPSAATDLPGPTHIQVRDGAVLVGRKLAYWGDVGLGDFLDALDTAVASAGPPPGAPFPAVDAEPIPEPSCYDADGEIGYDSFKSLLYHDFLARHDEATYPQIIADAGFSFLSNIDLPSAEGGFISQLAWAAIGYGVGATSGVTLANEVVGRHRRTITITGDGAFAEAVQAIGTVAQLGQDAVIFVMDNRVFAVEQWLVNADAFCPTDAPPFEALTQVPQGAIWDYVKLAEGFGGKGVRVETNAELAAALADLTSVPTNPTTQAPTFTLVAVRIPATSLPSNARWKMHCES